METNQLVGSDPKVILTRQSCGQRSNMDAGIKRQALAFLFFQTNLPYIPIVKNLRVKSSSVQHDLSNSKFAIHKSHA